MGGGAGDSKSYDASISRFTISRNRTCFGSARRQLAAEDGGDLAFTVGGIQSIRWGLN